MSNTHISLGDNTKFVLFVYSYCYSGNLQPLMVMCNPFFAQVYNVKFQTLNIISTFTKFTTIGTKNYINYANRLNWDDILISTKVNITHSYCAQILHIIPNNLCAVYMYMYVHSCTDAYGFIDSLVWKFSVLEMFSNIGLSVASSPL